MESNTNNARKILFATLIVVQFLQGTCSENNSTTTVSLTTNIPTTTCKINGSCTSDNVSAANFTTLSSAAQVTTISPETSSSSPTKSAFLEKKSSAASNNEICICDLKLAYCDVNCCCDKDCSAEDKSVFSHCEKDFHYYDTRFCSYFKHIYINKTLHRWEVSQNGLFCVVRSNLPPSYIVQRKHPLKSLQEVESAKRSKYSWPSDEIDFHPRFSSEKYVYGNPVWIVRNNVLVTLEIPKSYITDQCVIKENVKYLVDQKSSCSLQELVADDPQLKAKTYFENITVIGDPTSFNFTFYERKNIFKECPKNVCLPIEPKICDDDFKNCQKIAKNSSKLEPTCHLTLANNKNTCLNLVRGIKYVLHHNSSKGIKNVDLLITQKNITYYFGEDVNFVQTFETEFRWLNHSLNYSSYLSGNPGYIVGKPILTAKLISENVTINGTNNSTNTTQYINELKLFRDPLDFTDNFVVLPVSDSNGCCILNNSCYMPVEFGYDLYAKCTLNEHLSINKNTSARDVCVGIQNSIFQYWSLNVSNNSLTNKLVGEFGNANIFNPNEWLKVLYKKDLVDIVNNTWGEFGFKNETVKCGNVTTLLLMEFYHSRIDFDNIINQEKILAVQFDFGQFKTFTFPFYKKEGRFNFKVKIKTQVMFHDITSRKSRKIVDPPSLSIRLPHDFFYPFVKIYNNSVKEICYVSLVLYSFLFVMLL